jgi:hypothetical protein
MLSCEAIAPAVFCSKRLEKKIIRPPTFCKRGSPQKKKKHFSHLPKYYLEMAFGKADVFLYSKLVLHGPRR